MLRRSLHELAMAYEQACEVHGDDSRQALMIGEALLFMRGWMRRYSGQVQRLEPVV